MKRGKNRYIVVRLRAGEEYDGSQGGITFRSKPAAYKHADKMGLRVHGLQDQAAAHLPGGGLMAAAMTPAQGRILARRVAQSSCFWDAESQVLTRPEGGLLLAIIELSFAEIPQRFEPEPQRSTYKTDNLYRNALSKWKRRRLDGEDAWDFIMSERLETYTEHLDLDPEWVRDVVRRWVRYGREEAAA